MNDQYPAERPVVTAPLFTCFIELASASKPAYDLGPTPTGHRAVGTITGGWVRGDRVSATILDGIDYAIRRPDNALVPDIRLVLRTDDDQLILMSYKGVIEPWDEVLKARRGEAFDAAVINWKCVMTFETSAPKYDWLNRVQAVGRGAVADGGFHYYVYELV